VVLITGGSKGIGRGIAIQLARAGYRVAATHRSGDVPEGVLGVRCDVTDPGEVEAAFRQVEAALAGGPHADDSRWLACALLHDIGKLAAGLGIPGRVLATLVGRATDGAVGDWEEYQGLRRRIALYLRHPEFGADMIQLAGGRVEVAHWARAHHDRARLDPSLLPASVVSALVAADND